LSKAFLVGGVSVIPCPGCSEIEIQDKIKMGRLCLYSKGFIVTEERRIRNSVFDKRGEKTSTRLAWRSIKNKGEAKFIGRELENYIRERNDQAEMGK